MCGPRQAAGSTQTKKQLLAQLAQPMHVQLTSGESEAQRQVHRHPPGLP